MRCSLARNGFLKGSTAAYMALAASKNSSQSVSPEDSGSMGVDDGEGDADYFSELELEARLNDVGPVSRPRLASSVVLAKTPRKNHYHL